MSRPALSLLVALLLSPSAVLAQTAAPDAGAKAKQPIEVATEGVRLLVTPTHITAEKEGKRTWEFCGADELEFMREGNCKGTRSLEVISVVGRYLSFNSVGDFDCGGAHPVGSMSSRTIDLHTGKDVTLTELFPERELVKTLVRDPYVRKTLDPQALEALRGKSLKEALDALGPLLSDPLGGVAAYESDFLLQGTEKGRTLVRVIFTATSHATRGERLVLGLSLKTPPELEKAVAAAGAGKEGFFPPRKFEAACMSPLGD